MKKTKGTLTGRKLNKIVRDALNYRAEVEVKDFYPKSEYEKNILHRIRNTVVNNYLNNKMEKSKDLYWVSSTGCQTLKELEETMQAWMDRGTFNRNTKVLHKGKVYVPKWELKLKEI